MNHSLKDIYQKFLQCNSVSIDSRTLQKNAMFFALKGSNYNGNKFAEDAIEKGALFAVIDCHQDTKTQRTTKLIFKKIFVKLRALVSLWQKERFQGETSGTTFIIVKNVLETLQELAHLHRQNFNIPFLAITGTNGKTTTKELINVILSKKYKTSATKGNFNNHIGVPLTLLSIKKDAEFAIIEMGANHIGEIAKLCEIAMPNFGMITNIGKAHLEGFLSFEGVAKAKSELYYYLFKHNGKVFFNSKNEHLTRMASRFSDPIKYGTKEDFYHCELMAHSVERHAPMLIFKAQNGDIVNTNLIGSYNLENIEAALCIGKYFKVNEKDANKAIAEYTPQCNRSEIKIKGTNIIICDAYNANPQSMEASIKDFASNPLAPGPSEREKRGIGETERKKTKRFTDSPIHLFTDSKESSGGVDLERARGAVLILGDMLELGDQSANEHKTLGRFISSLVCNGADFKNILLCGKAMKNTISQLTQKSTSTIGKEDLMSNIAIYFKDKAALTNWLKNNKFRNCYFLIKGSRSMELETVVDYI